MSPRFSSLPPTPLSNPLRRPLPNPPRLPASLVLMTGMFRGWRASLLKTPSRTGGEGEEVVVVGEE